MGRVQQQFFPDSSRPEILVDLWLPEGSEHLQPVPVVDHLRKAPWSAPPAR